ncbi:MAG: DUF2256 domain-containing protein [Polynucleobacter sp.]|nr:DUF2256 domain-containing protein [Polynucleobacter sp.]
MGMRKKRDLPSKVCVCCGRPFNWRKKWEKVWEEVKYCSDRCRHTKKYRLDEFLVLLAVVGSSSFSV